MKITPKLFRYLCATVILTMFLFFTTICKTYSQNALGSDELISYERRLDSLLKKEQYEDYLLLALKFSEKNQKRN